MDVIAQLHKLRAEAWAQLERLNAERAAAARAVEMYDDLIRLHESHSAGTISGMQAENSHSLGVRIAEGRAGQSKSRKAQIVVNLTDKEVAEITGYSRSTVCKWHNGSMKIPEEAKELLAKRGIPANSWTKR